MANTEVLRLRRNLPIPVGHRLEVEFFVLEEESLGFLGGGQLKKSSLAEPAIRDLDTGISYGHLSHYGDGIIHTGKSNIETLERRPGLTVERTLTGKVIRCQITEVSFEGQQLSHIETWLEIES